MAKYQLLLPKMGESVAEATIIKWNKKPGDYIEADEAVMEIATDKVDSEVPSPVSGKLVEQLCKEDDIVQVGSVIAIIETDAPEENSQPVAEEKMPEQPVAERVEEIQPEVTEQPKETQQPEPAQQPEAVPVADIPGLDQLEPKEEQQAAPVAEGVKYENRFYSPLVKNIAIQEGIGNDELDRIPGTGAEGRLTKDDLLEYIQKRGAKSQSTQNFIAQQTAPVATETTAPQQEQAPLPKAEPIFEASHQQVPPAPQPGTEASKAEPAPAAPAAATSVSGGQEIIEMDRMRKLIADHMVYSKQTSPHVTSFVEADVTELVLWREKVKNSFEKREGEKITFTPIFIEAVVKAIKDFPMINVSVNGTQIIKKKDINISMATALPSGNLIVPVIKKADELSLIGLTKAVNDLANRARGNKLQPDDVREGTFTITNVGSFGNVMGTPIINQPQVAILAVGAIKKKPAVIETPKGDAIAIRHMMFLSLSYDHRVVDGALGGSFVSRVAHYLENWDPNRSL
ncbi:2-oxo acid dehydrogenase subunit E2 [Mucilaginibacter conchicola]|uniref:Dihydrolipoamide acetyltransferase component of pyruvate dehydrogenase complex n=1 Tax=Mucilaginibacter conchicola TaxID=2303333 RepID=A0A372NWS3_9SPHI|nr:dihydrolipoamide acetyltransferase family protein [Mucilaginibacter conchicola]RFZ94354.1 2-oxo acid dehydrogenase subunit E2 [Mucilaginibacter conchicola]